MKATFRLSMTRLHTWSGLLLGWILFAIFITGTAAYFKAEISRWMQPEIVATASPMHAAGAAFRQLDKLAAQSPRWFIELPTERVPATTVFWQEPGEGRRFGNAKLDAATGERVNARDSRGGEIFYRFHFQLQLPHPWGRYVAGVAAMFMFVALISGVITHRHFFKEFFTFRPGRAPLRSFLDFHNVTAVLALPFYFLISYSALVIFMSMYMPWGRLALTDSSAATVVKPSASASPAKEKSGGADATWFGADALTPLLATVATEWGSGPDPLKRIEVTGRGTTRPVAIFTRTVTQSISIADREQIRFNPLTGERLPSENKVQGPATTVHGAIYGLHLAHFAGPALRWMFFLMGLFGSALVATGLVMWTLKRRSKYAKAGRTSFGHGLVERLNIATIAGLPAAMAALFWANRLLPMKLAARADWEVRVFLIVWAALLLHTLVRPIARAWREQFWLGAFLFCALPIVDALTGPFLFRALRNGDAAYLGFHATVVFTGAALAYAAIKLQRRANQPAALAAPEAKVPTKSAAPDLSRQHKPASSHTPQPAANRGVPV